MNASSARSVFSSSSTFLTLKGVPPALPGWQYVFCRSPRTRLSNGQGFSVLEVVRAVKQVTGLNVPVMSGNRRAGDPAALFSDATKAREQLGWQPYIAELDDIVRTAWAWHQKLPSAATPKVEAAGA